jgi:acyl-CoA thioesterase-2
LTQCGLSREIRDDWHDALVPQSIAELLALLDLETIEMGLYRGRQPQTEMQRVFGGQVAGQALVAAMRTVPEDRPAHSLHAYFLRPGDTTVPILYDVELIRDGRSFTTRRVIARQHGRPIFGMSASFQQQEDGLDHQDPMPEVPDPAGLPTLAEAIAKATGRNAYDIEREWSALDVRYAGDSRAGGSLSSGAHAALARVWLRTSDSLPDDDRVHRAVLAYASDLTLLGASLVPHGLAIGDQRLRAASLDHAMWFHRPFRADEWLLYDQMSPSASGGRGFSIGRLFSADGRQVASVVQEGLIRTVEA